MIAGGAAGFCQVGKIYNDARVKPHNVTNLLKNLYQFFNI